MSFRDTRGQGPVPQAPVAPATPDSIPPTPAPAPHAGGVSWPAAFLASVIVVAGLFYHYMLVMHGVDPVRAASYLLLIEVPLVALVLPASSVGSAVRAACSVLGLVFGKLGDGGPR